MQVDRVAVLAELAPTGRIRAAVNTANAVLAKIDARTGNVGGLSAEIAGKLADDLQCGLSFVTYASAAEILSAIDRDEWDIAFIADDPSRADRFSFSPPYTTVTATYLVPAASAFWTAEEVDINGCRIAAARSAAYTKQLERMIQHAGIMHAESAASAVETLVAGGCDAAAGLRESLLRFSEGDPCLRVVEGAFSEIPQSIAVRCNAPIAAAYLREFVVWYLATTAVPSTIASEHCDKGRDLRRAKTSWNNWNN